jgi:hypothetical protein
MRICWENVTTKTAPVPICPPQIPHDLSWDSEPDRRDWKPATNSPTDDTALSFSVWKSQLGNGLSLIGATLNYIRYREALRLNCNAKSNSEVLIMTVNRKNRTMMSHFEALLNNRFKKGQRACYNRNSMKVPRKYKSSLLAIKLLQHYYSLCSVVKFTLAA